MKIRVGTRGSRLALTQTNMVIEALKGLHEDLEAAVTVIKTKGDRITDISLEKIGDKGLFVKEIEEQLLMGNIDIAIHSMKDMPYEMPEGLTLVPVLEREDPRDVLVTPHKIRHLDELPVNARIATGSKRRSSQLKTLMPSVSIEPIRGNVETRIQKMLDRGLDGTILAVSGLTRLGIVGDDTFTLLPFSVEQMIPAPAQGILGLQFRDSDPDIKALIQGIIDEKTLLQCQAERTFLHEVNGSCHLPIGAYLEGEDEVSMYGIFGDEACNNVKSMTLKGSRVEAVAMASDLAHKLVEEVKTCK